MNGSSNRPSSPEPSPEGELLGERPGDAVGEEPEERGEPRSRTTEELVGRKPRPEDFEELPRAPLHVVLADVRGLANVGLAFRLCDNLRVAHLWLCGITGHPPYPGDPRAAVIAERCDREIRRTAVMAVPFVPWTYAPSALEVVAARKAAGDRIVVLEQAEGALPPAKADLTAPLCLVLGHERQGVAPEILREADLVLEIPVWGMANSLNVAMSLAVVGYEAARQNAGFGLEPL
ncbi:TrmH family RNA methyltransferase [Vulgatibacter incomptus]|uniref:TrmH family RNA methyltransferase n=1 Tax=Vulgatibacter incomptus TaxID=1391653 RepID=UPI0014706159|nr:TrmH family RNA methyltransferase [Vulgatibacter incomptus]